MPFYDHLKRLGADDMLNSPIAPMFDLRYLLVVAETLLDYIKAGLRIKVIRDYDPDGLYAGEVVDYTLKSIGYRNYSIAKYSRRTHDVDINAVLESYSDNSEVLLILDTGSSELEYLKRLVSQGKKVVVIDHHQSNYTYEEYYSAGVAIVNTTMEAKDGKPFYKMSAASLTYFVMTCMLKLMGKVEPPQLAVSATCSLFSDSIDLSPSYNRYLYNLAVSRRLSDMPNVVLRFMTERTVLTRRFIEFSVNPPLNTLFRSENFELLNKLLAWNPSTDESMLEIVEKVREESRKYSSEVSRISEIISTEIAGEFVVGNLSSVVDDTFIDEFRIVNYTGLVANKLAEKFNRPAIVYANTGVDIKGSLRDVRGRNYLGVFKSFSNSNGHNSAFAINIPYRGFMKFQKYLSLVDTKGSLDFNEPIIVDANIDIPTVEMIKDISTYNEFAGGSFPFYYVTRLWRRQDRKKHSTSFYNYYEWAGHTVRSKSSILPNTKVIMKPYRQSRNNNGSWKTEIMVEGVTR